jgi:hypothetical protein
VKDQSDNYGKGVFRVKGTPFDTLAITTATNENFTKQICYILKNMEEDNQVFTLAYHDGKLFISPRKNINDHRRIQIGAGVYIHFFDTLKKDTRDQVDEQFLARLKTHMPMQGEYNWRKYLE